TTDRNLLRQAVRGIVATQQPTRLEKALRQAESLANPPRSADDAKVRPADEDPARAKAYVPPEGIKAEGHLYSDGCFSPSEAEALGRFAAGTLDIRYHQVGRPGGEGVDNVGLASFNVKESPNQAGKLLVSALVVNYRRDPAAVKVELKWHLRGKPADFKLADRVVNLAGPRLGRADAENGDLEFDQPGHGLPDLL